MDSFAGDDIRPLVHPEWPPLRHIRRGWDALAPDERRAVQERLDRLRDAPIDGPREATLPFFAFLAQVETIAIEIPLRFLPEAPEALRPTLRNQLQDEVFHSLLFARIAHQLAVPDAVPPPPLASAERLLDRIRAEEDLGVSATLLNLVAEGWIENLFRHAADWGVADAVFEEVLGDEARHVAEADLYQGGMDPARAQAAVAALEEGLLEVMQEPSVAVAVLDLAGPDRYRAMSESLYAQHRRRLEEAGLHPGPAWEAQEAARRDLMAVMAQEERAEVVPDTPWRASARRVWDTPRDPTMQGDLDVPVGHIPKRLLTPVLVAALGQVWAENPDLNRIVAKGKVWRLPKANVGVRVLIDDGELATVVVTEADKRSLRDIGRILQDGVETLQAVRAEQKRSGRDVAPFDDRAMARFDPGPAAFAVALSNPGKFGLVRGGGALSGAVAPSSDVSVGERRRLPVWRGIAYLPAWHVNLGCLQDHRVFDGKEAGTAMRALRKALSRKGVKAIRKRPDTLPEEDSAEWDAMLAAAPKEMRMLASVGLSKYVPIALGGAAIGTGVGVGAYLLAQHLGTAEAAAGGGAGAAGASGASEATGAAGPEEADGGESVPPGQCHGVTAKGTPCKNPAGGSGYCHRHGGP